MSDRESSDNCSTCEGSHHDANCCDSDDSLHQSDLEWTNESCDLKGHLFYLKVSDDSHQEIADKLEPNQLTKGDTNQRFRSSYTKLASWVFDNKRFGGKKMSFKRKSSRKKAKLQNVSDSPIIKVSHYDDKTLAKLIKDGDVPQNVLPDDFVLMYLTPPSENNAVERDCLVFSYPTQDTEQSRNPILLKLKGMFITMSQVVCQITNQLPILSSISVNQNDTERVYTVAFVHEYSSMLALSLPSERYERLEVTIMIETIARMIRFIYNSLDAAFKNDSNHEYLQKICKTLCYILRKKDDKEMDLNLYINTIPRLLIDDDLSLQINDSISEYEAMDWLSDDEHNETHHNMAKDFIVIGSCVIYKEHLISSHLPVNYLLDIIGFLRLRGLLALQMMRLVVWNEVHPVSLRSESNDYVANEGVKYFLAIIGVNNMLHCTLLEMPFISYDTNQIKPNETIVNESIHFLTSQMIRSGIVDELEHYLRLQKQINNNDSDKFGRKRYKSLSSLMDLIPGFSSASKQQMYHSTNSLLSIDRESPVSDSHKSHSTQSLQHSILSQTSSSASLCQSVTGLVLGSTLCHNDSPFLQQNSSLPENLMCYLDIENGMQIIGGPILSIAKDIRNEICKKFFGCCFYISNQLKNCVNTDDVNEFGMTFEMPLSNESKSKNKSNNEMVVFYVIGKTDSDRNEFYICFQLNNSCPDIDIHSLAYNLRLSRRLI